MNLSKKTKNSEPCLMQLGLPTTGSEKNKWWDFFGSKIYEQGFLDWEACWNWIKAKDQDGYGHAFYEGRQWRSNRLSFFLWNGEIPPGRQVLHKCDNPSCVNPLHLFAGTEQDNVDDCITKGRRRNAVGSGIAGSKLTEQQVAEIRSLYLKRSKDRNMPALARKYGVQKTTVHAIVKNRSWRHVVASTTPQSKWAYDYDFCIECKKSEHPHQAKGLCEVCYQALLYQFNRLSAIFGNQ